MAVFVEGNMWDVFDTVDCFILPTCREVVNKQLLVDGITKEAADKFDGLLDALTHFVDAQESIYGIRTNTKVGIFQNRILLSDDINLGVLSYSLKELVGVASHFRDRSYALAHPAQELPTWLIMPMLEWLPDNVQVWSKP